MRNAGTKELGFLLSRPSCLPRYPLKVNFDGTYGIICENLEALFSHRGFQTNPIFMALELEQLTDKVIGACIAVHKEKGPGFLESIYENCLKIELRKHGFKAEFQKEVDVYYDGELVGTHKLDILINDCLIVELKAIKALEDVHFAQVRSYLRATNLKHGLLINFATLTLTVKRVI